MPAQPFVVTNFTAADMADRSPTATHHRATPGHSSGEVDIYTLAASILAHELNRKTDARYRGGQPIISDDPRQQEQLASLFHPAVNVSPQLRSAGITADALIGKYAPKVTPDNLAARILRHEVLRNTNVDYKGERPTVPDDMMWQSHLASRIHFMTDGNNVARSAGITADALIAMYAPKAAKEIENRSNIIRAQAAAARMIPSRAPSVNTNEFSHLRAAHGAPPPATSRGRK